MTARPKVEFGPVEGDASDTVFSSNPMPCSLTCRQHEACLRAADESARPCLVCYLPAGFGPIVTEYDGSDFNTGAVMHRACWEQRKLERERRARDE